MGEWLKTDIPDTFDEVRALRQEIAFLYTWQGLIHLLDQQYAHTDTTPRVVALAREVDQLRRAQTRVLELCAERERSALFRTPAWIEQVRDAYRDGAGL